MSYTKANGQFANTEDVSLHPSATRTTTANGTVVYEAGDRARVSLLLNVSAASGTTPTLDVTVEGSQDGTTFYTLGTFAQKTTTGSERKAFLCDRFVRVRWTIGGTTPSFTFAVTGEAA